MNSPRKLLVTEKAVITALLQGKVEAIPFIDTLEDLVVNPMNDGAMGSLSLIPKGLENASRSFGHELVLGEFIDGDGVPVSLAVNVDDQGRLYELDVWKVTFSSLLVWPDPTDIKIVS